MTRTGGFQDDDFWTEFHDFPFSEQRHERAEELLDTSPLLTFPQGSRVLDLGCGPGVFTVPLARRGHRVTGVDVDEWARRRSEWVLVRGERVTRATLTWFVYSAVELRRMAEEAGFDRVEVFGGFDGRPYGESTERLLRAVREA
ncbi:class I SAM-dependent methyltransferase [Streptomyces cellulosae]|uniref:Class I SAM-dependent methyltransferase n=1 Tax=Streptomyces cellulosae TaxID=1968 RepID=A0ABW6JQL0_STRCE|nr:hypothetical protein GCM10018771_72600 [Streptomyces cellulosae]